MWTTLASDAILEKTIQSLKTNGVDAMVVDTGEQAKAKVLELIPKGAEVMTRSSMTLETIGLIEAINTSGHFAAVKPKLMAMDRKTQSRDMQKLGTAPEWAVGSANAVTEEGQMIFASDTGSQIPAYAYGSAHIILIVGTQKIVPTLGAGMKRLNEYVIPLVDEQIQKKFGRGTRMNKLLTVYGDRTPGRITVIFIKEALGF
jgi:hypothetical protein